MKIEEQQSEEWIIKLTDEYLDYLINRKISDIAAMKKSLLSHEGLLNALNFEKNRRTK